MMHRSHTLLAAARPLALVFGLGVGGCVVYDNNCEADDKAHGTADTGAMGSGADDGGDGLVDEAPLLLLDPDTVAPGQTLIASLVTDPEAEEAFDFATVAEVRFSAGITVCSDQARAGELLLSLVVDEAAPAGMVDLMVVLEDGERVVLADAVEVVASGDGAPEDGAAGDDPGDEDGGFVDEGAGDTGAPETGAESPCR